MDSPNIIPRPSGNQHYGLVALACLLLTALLYGQTFSHQFVYFDDDGYVLNNLMVRAGLSLEGIRWAFQTMTTSDTRSS